MKKKLIVTHHSPDLDAIGAVWLLKRFDPQEYEDAKVAFVNPGERIKEAEAANLGYSLTEVTHVDTGLGKFDHHQPERASQPICAASLAYQHVCQVSPSLQENKALKELVKFINEIDHFQEINWPDSSHLRYTFMIHELIRGYELVDSQNDQSQLEFGEKCLDCAYQILKQTISANDLIESSGIQFHITAGACIALETSNEETLKQAQKQGYLLVLRKDPEKGHIRIKIRPDASFNLKPLYQAIKEIDEDGSWFYHPGGKMLLNGSLKHRNQTPSSLSIQDVIKLIKQVY
ncbi:MAG: hypothetical protein XD95_0192 [Microgenomates bacterium 39_7]|nr:MAG: hypothetical protein XD95_0192 [Microgenomates bacterium 39_7]